jgi:hypothetical protein
VHGAPMHGGRDASDLRGGAARRASSKKPAATVSAVALSKGGADGDFLYATCIDNSLWKLNVRCLPWRAWLSTLVSGSLSHGSGSYHDEMRT